MVSFLWNATSISAKRWTLQTFPVNSNDQFQVGHILNKTENATPKLFIYPDNENGKMSDSQIKMF